MRARTSTPGPAVSTMGARMKTAWYGSSPSVGTLISRLEALALGAKGVAADADVHRRQQRLPGERVVGLAGEQDQASAGAPDREAARDEVADGLVEVIGDHQLAHHCTLAARDDKAVESLQVAREANRPGARAEPLHGREMLAEVALEGERADRQGPVRLNSVIPIAPPRC